MISFATSGTDLVDNMATEGWKPEQNPCRRVKAHVYVYSIRKRTCTILSPRSFHKTVEPISVDGMGTGDAGSLQD